MIAIDTQLMYGTPTGIGEYLHGLIPALREQDLAFKVLAQSNFDPWRFDRRVIWDQLLLPLKSRPYRLLHCTSGTMPFMPLRAATLVTVHDVAWLRVQEHARFYARSYFGAMMLNAYRRATCIVTVSAFSRTELLSFGGFDQHRVHVIHPGVASDYSHITRQLEPQPSQAPLILAVGTVERRKNLAMAIRALAAMENRRARLISCGPPTPYLDECRQLAQDLGVAHRVEFRGYVKRAELLELYTRASAAVVPSIYEGFGLGAAQALVAGVPLLAAATSSLPEIAGEGARLLDPVDTQAWADELDEVIANPISENERAQAFRRQAQEKFSWTQAAKKNITLYESILEN